jgi:MarR family transcriptional regulator for hemolysin
MLEPKTKRSASTSRRETREPGKKRDTMRWMPEVSKNGELFLRRTERPPQGEGEDIKYPFSQGLTFVARRWRNLMNEELRAIGQSQARYSTLYWITVFGDSVNQTELADRIGVEQPTLGRVLRDLESEGLITRSSGSGDRRAKVIRFTEAAKPLLDRVNSIQERVRLQLLQGIAAKDLLVCMAVFARILSNMDRDKPQP